MNDLLPPNNHSPSPHLHAPPAPTGEFVESIAERQYLREWLDGYADNRHTQAVYGRAAWLLWMWLGVRRQRLLSLSATQVLEFDRFLQDPQPRERWCGPTYPRKHPQWRPLRGPLKSNSRAQVHSALNTCFSYLQSRDLVTRNPWQPHRRLRRLRQPISIERYLDEAAWQTLWQYINQLPRKTPAQSQKVARLQFLLSFFYLLGPRLHEVANHTMNSFVERRGRWWWEMVGKGNKPGRVPVNADMLAALKRYRTSYGWSPLPAPDDERPLVASIKGTRPIGSDMIYRLIKKALRDAATYTQDPAIVHQLQHASTHWLRHTSLTHQALAGLDVRHIQRNARHSSLTMTTRYLHAEEQQWHDDMQRHRLPTAPRNAPDRSPVPLVDLSDSISESDETKQSP